MNFKILLLLFVIGFAFQSCDLVKEPAIEGTNTQAMAGEWYVALYDDAGEQLTAISSITTSNTAANLPTEMWLIDHGIFGQQFLVATDQSALTFNANKSGNKEFADGDAPDPEQDEIPAIGTTEEVSSAVPEFATITGSILKNAAHPPSKTVTDSIRLTITGIYRTTVYQVSGYDINGTDTLVNWTVQSVSEAPDGPYIMAGYRRTGFLEDEH